MTDARRRSWAEPWKVKVIEHLKMTTREERQRAIVEAGYNTFLLRSEDVYIDGRPSRTRPPRWQRYPSHPLSGAAGG
jgi:hypothetical protein